MQLPTPAPAPPPAPEPDFSEFMWMAEQDLDQFDQQVEEEIRQELESNASNTSEQEEFYERMLEEQERERSRANYERSLSLEERRQLEERDTVYFNQSPSQGSSSEQLTRQLSDLSVNDQTQPLSQQQQHVQQLRQQQLYHEQQYQQRLQNHQQQQQLIQQLRQQPGNTPHTRYSRPAPNDQQSATEPSSAAQGIEPQALATGHGYPSPSNGRLNPAAPTFVPRNWLLHEAPQCLARHSNVSRDHFWSDVGSLSVFFISVE